MPISLTSIYGHRHEVRICSKKLNGHPHTSLWRSAHERNSLLTNVDAFEKSHWCRSKCLCTGAGRTLDIRLINEQRY